jgi:hypothetical protein
MARSTAKTTAAKKTAAKKTTTAKKTAAKRPAQDTPSTSTAPDQPNEEAADQHPALDGKPGVEVSERSTDQPKPDTLTHRKDFVLLKREYESNDHAELHRANVEATRQYLISQGMRPTADGKFTSAEDHPDGVSVILHYDVPVVPAVTATVDDEGEAVVHAHVTLDDQHEREQERRPL